MSRAALPPVPSVCGTPAEYTAATFARVWPERRVTWVERAHPTPTQRAISVAATAVCVPKNARKIGSAALALAWPTRITHAVGYAFDAKTGSVKMKDVMELTGEVTDKGNPRKRKVGEVPSDPVDSLRVAVRTPRLLLAGHWVDGGWESGVILSGTELVRNVGWNQLWEAFNAESEADMRGEDRQSIGGAAELPADGNQRSTLF